MVNAFITAFNERGRHGHAKINTGHLLFGAVAEQSFPRNAEEILRKAGVTSNRVRNALVELWGSGIPQREGPETSGFYIEEDARVVLQKSLADVQGYKIWEPSALHAFERSREIALDHSHADLSTLHLLMAVLEESGAGSDVLELIGVDVVTLTSKLRGCLVLLPRVPTPRRKQQHESVTFANPDPVKVWDQLVECMKLHPGWTAQSATLTVVF
jgi:ATP-dependent Clp protease ATP-binding subunit ClpA